MDSKNSQQMNKKQITKNIFILSIAHYLTYQASQTLSNLQSTLNAADGIGIISLSVQYGTALICILFLSEILIKSFGCKKMIILMFILQWPSYASNFYPIWETMIPSAALAGVTLGLVLMGASVYINEMCVCYHVLHTSESLESITARFYGIFTFFAENASIWGNLMSYYTLRPEIAPDISNRTNVTCGIKFESGDGAVDNDNLQPPTDEKRYFLVGVCLASAVLSIILVIAFLDELDLKADVKKETKKWKSVLMSLSSASRHVFNPDQLLLLPITTFFGMESAFFTAEITQAYIACSWGMYNIGFVAVCHGVCGAIMGFCVGYLVKYTSQTFAIILAACLNTSVLIVLIFWQPSPEFIPAYFMVAGAWGASDAIWWSQLGALYGLMFPSNREAAFSNLYFWTFLGFAVSYSYSNYLTVWIKIVILLCVLVAGMACYLVGQIKIKYRTNKRIYAINS